jgi:outer membrane protein, heavy metal efflux system
MFLIFSGDFMRFYIAALACAAVLHAQPDSLALPEALARTQAHPSLAARDLEAKALDAQAGKAGALANPHLSAEAENFAGSGALAGIGALETTVRFEQAIPLGGKRSGQRRQAGAEARAARLERDRFALELERRVRETFYEALAAQEHEALAIRKIAVLDRAARAAERRRAAGGGSPSDALKLSVERAYVEQERNRASLDASLARARLAELTGDSAGIPGVRGALSERDMLPAWEVVKAAVEWHPDLKRFVAVRAARRAILDLARAERVPDLSVNAGVRRLNAPGGSDMAMVGGVSLSLPLWNRNAGNVAGGELRLSAAERDEGAARRERMAEARALWESLALRGTEVERLGSELLPQAERAAIAAREAYASGRHSVLEMLDSERLLFETNDSYLEALATWHRDDAALRAVAGLTPVFSTPDAERE